VGVDVQLLRFLFLLFIMVPDVSYDPPIVLMLFFFVQSPLAVEWIDRSPGMGRERSQAMSWESATEPEEEH
jgi:hypothetical protein